MPFYVRRINGSARVGFFRKQQNIKISNLGSGRKEGEGKPHNIAIPHVHRRVKHIQHTRKRRTGLSAAFSGTPRNRECLLVISGTALHLS